VVTSEGTDAYGWTHTHTHTKKDLKHLGMIGIKYSLFWAGGTCFLFTIACSCLVEHESQIGKR
jgi:hypothetical protein